METYVRCCKALSDATRLRIVRALLAAGGELCICEIMDALALAQYTVSRHMKELKTAGLVGERRQGRFIFYSLRRPSTRFVRFVLEAAKAMEGDVLDGDGRRLIRRLRHRAAAVCLPGSCLPGDTGRGR